ncbi:hypothetical protein ACJMK2_034788 [Sinanodonta woodiana]|uniref:Uncharacterized protein n=1 Tax=Sinanodonta woodiana TaxID=1069815 RepID=A0ABD3WTA9_SINWO
MQSAVPSSQVVLVVGGIINLLCFEYIIGARFVFEAEDAIIDKGRTMKIMSRSSATKAKAVSFNQGDTFHFEFCLTDDSEVKIEQLQYSNDGGSDLVLFSIDTVDVAELTTEARSQFGKHWNDFQIVHNTGAPRVFSVGRHRLTVTILKSDIFGVEIDNLEISTNNQHGEFEFKCMVYCFSNIKYNMPVKNYNHGLARVVQRSRYTQCSEEDNVNIPIFVSSARTIQIMATLPKYTSFNNSREADFTNCHQVSSLWKFNEIEFSSTDYHHQKYNIASISGIGNRKQVKNIAALIAGSNDKEISVSIVFRLDGPNEGVVDSEIGSDIYFRFKEVHEPCTVSMEYFGRDRKWSTPVSKEFNKYMREHIWMVPDFTWREGEDNRVKFIIHSKTRDIVNIEGIEMTRRPRRQTRFFHMYNSGKNLVEGANTDFWWLINQTMTVKLVDSGEIFYAADYFRIYDRIPWTKDHYSQIFVIYQDGNIRLLPVTPHGLDWIPFGSSLLIGQTNPIDIRPSASIRHIDLEVKTLTLQIYYHDGGSLKMKIVPTLTYTSVEISDLKLTKDPQMHPFMTFRSMWVGDGNADIDHISVDDQEPHHIMSMWHELRGHSMAFFRQCISQHNTLSPDLQILIDQ